MTVRSGYVRVWGHVNAKGLRAARWQDVPDDDHLADLLALGFASTVGQRGEPAPPVVTPPSCCGRR